MPRTRPKLLSALPNRLWRDREGASLLEFTVVLPFLLVFGLGVVEFGNALYQYHLVTAGLRDAGRYLASAGYEDANDDFIADPGEMDPDGSRRTIARNIAVCGEAASCTNDNKRLSWWPADVADIDDVVAVKYCMDGAEEGDTIPDCNCDDPPDLQDGPGFGSNKVCVSTTATYGELGFLTYLGLGPLTFTTGHEERYYGIR